MLCIIYYIKYMNIVQIIKTKQFKFKKQKSKDG